MNLLEFIKKSPKAELHLHIEGTLEPGQMFDLAKKNNIQRNTLLLKRFLGFCLLMRLTF